MPEVDILGGFSICFENSIEELPGYSKSKRPAAITGRVSGTTVNTLLCLRKLGREVRLIGTIGQNLVELGFLSQWLFDEGIRNKIFYFARERTARSTVLIPVNGSSVIYSDKPSYRYLPRDRVQEELKENQARVVLATGIIREELPLLETLFSGQGIHILNPRKDLVADKEAFAKALSLTDVLMINEAEMSIIIRNKVEQANSSGQKLIDCGFLHELGPEIIILTHDSRGATLTTRQGELIHQPAILVGDCRDTTGAGDCFLAGFINAYYFEEQDLAIALEFAALVAGIKVTKVGGSNVPTKEEIKKHSQLVRS